ncbi:hypothetical protein [Cryptosporangium phraense]|uniref:MBL fold metallo-hydrolase n=1 Tax=Cryptosporangium phraense TaxID=2593070 RepID=A0A545AF46_9ACTN|nr:hypothetical protein [Cryptosporangium phraense]TQS39951.1 hypothetical protein FL583_37345 [Cryptosporangium phraense]
MAWSLEIRHIAIAGTGDSTVIVARDDGVGAGHVAQTRTCLIDGGKGPAKGQIDGVLRGLPRGGGGGNITQLDVMVLTHYDADHMTGLRDLLSKTANAPFYGTTLIYDQGEPSALGFDENTYLGWVNAIRGRPGCTRVTRNVAADQARVNKGRYGLPLQPSNIQVRTVPAMWPLVGVAGIPNNPLLGALPAPLAVPAGPLVAANQWWHAYWLVGREILWTDAAGDPIAPAGALAAAALAPTITCVAANRYVRNDAVGGPARATYLPATLLAQGDQVKNEKSLAFEVRFGNFRYYIGGDIESPQENTIPVYLNPNDSVAGRVHVTKTSHHGAETATSRAFVDRMRPLVAVSSCGARNQFRHPRPETVWSLDGVAVAALPPATPPKPGRGTTAAQKLAWTLAPPPALPAARARRSVAHYLTGFQDPATSTSMATGTIGGLNSGDPLNILLPHDVTIRVTADQSVSNPLGSLGVGLVETIRGTATPLGLGAPAPALLDGAVLALDTAPDRAAAADAVVRFLLTQLGYAGAIAVTVAAVTAGGPLGTLVQLVRQAATNAGVPHAPASVVAAAGKYVVEAHGMALVTDRALAADRAVVDAAAVLPFGVQPLVNQAVHATGLFSVTYHEMLPAPGGPRTNIYR